MQHTRTEQWAIQCSQKAMWLASVFTNFFASFSNEQLPMAPGNLQAVDFSHQRSKFSSKPYPLRNSTSRNCALNMELSNDNVKEADGLEKVTVERAINGDSENNPGLDTNCNKTASKGRYGGNGNNKERDHWNTEYRLRTQIRNLKSLSLLHLDVIDQQQRQLSACDKELSKVRSEKYTLEQRLERMQRRTSLAEKAVRGHGQAQVERTTEPSSTVKRKADISTQSSPAAKRSQSVGKDEASSKQTRLDQPQDKRRLKQQRKDDVTRKGKLKTKENSTADEIGKLFTGTVNEKCQEVNQEKEDKKKVVKLEDRYLFTDVLYPTLQDLRVVLHDPDLPSNTSNVEVPSWRTSQQTTTPEAAAASDELENVEDDTYDRRHSKMELEEKKRKRWDAQRIRELRTVEKMEWKAVQKEMAKWAHIVTTYSPEPNDTKKIEVADSIPVIAFGALVPKLKNVGFSLPWFDLAKKERDETRRQTRSRASKK